MFDHINDSLVENDTYSKLYLALQHTCVTSDQNISENYMNKIPRFLFFFSNISQPENRHQLSGKIQFCVKHAILWPALLSHFSVLVKIKPKQI